MIKNSTFNVYDRMDKDALKAMALSFEADFAAAKDAGQRYDIKARLAIVYGLLKYKIHEAWLPTPENINALPEPVRKFISDLETNVDPQGMVRENFLIKDTCRALVIRLEEKKPRVDLAFICKEAEQLVRRFHGECKLSHLQKIGIHCVLAEKGDLWDLLVRAGVKVVK